MEKFKQWARENSHILMGLCVIFSILAFASMVLLMAFLIPKSTSTSDDDCDKSSFYFGVSFSGFKEIVQLAYNDGLISDKEFTKYDELESKAVYVEGDTLYSKDILACIEYAMSLEGLNKYFQRYQGDAGFDFEKFTKSSVDKKSFMEGLVIGASGVYIEIWNDAGLISYREYKRLMELYDKIFQNPTHQGCEEYVKLFNEVMIEVIEKEYADGEAKAQQHQRTAASGPLVFYYYF